MVRHAPIHRRSGHSDIAICCGRNVRGSSPSTSVVPLSNQVTTLNHKRFKGFKMFSDGHSDQIRKAVLHLSESLDAEPNKKSRHADTHGQAWEIKFALPAQDAPAEPNDLAEDDGEDQHGEKGPNESPEHADHRLLVPNRQITPREH